MIKFKKDFKLIKKGTELESHPKQAMLEANGYITVTKAEPKPVPVKKKAVQSTSKAKDMTTDKIKGKK